MNRVLKNLFLVLLLIVCEQLHAATKTWDGGGGDNNWTTAANWDLDVAPSAGDALVFAGATRTSPVNDFANGTSFASITFSNGASSFSCSGNDITLSGGASAITASNASNTMTIANNITFSTSAPTVTSTSGGSLTISGTVANGGLLLTIAGDGTITISGVLSGTGALTINTILDNATILSGTNTFTGNVTITVGGIRISNASGLGSGAKTITMTNGQNSSLRLDGSGGDITLPNTLSFNISAASGNYGGIISEAGNNTVQSDMSVPIGGGGVRLMSNAGTITGTGTYTPTAASRILALYGSSNGTFSGIWLDAGYSTKVEKYGTGTWTLTNTGNTYAGLTYIQVGTLKLGAAGVITDASAVTGSGTLDMNTYSETVGSIAMAGTIDNVSGGGTPTLTCGGDNTSTTNAGVIKNTTGTLSLTKTGSGTLTLTGTNTFSGAATISAGTLSIGNGSTTGSVATTSIVNNNALIVNRSNAITYSGVISGSGTLDKQGAGTLTLSGANTYTGTTTITGGAITLGASERISNSSNLIMKTGSTLTAAYTETMGTLQISSGGPGIYLSTGNHTLTFAASAAVDWSAGNYLYIHDWLGGYDGTAAGGSDPKLFIGTGNNTAVDLTAAQLAQITFYRTSNTKNYTAVQLATGEVVPTSTLPVELVSFTGKKENSEVILNWETATEINSDYYDVLRSTDDKTFESIGKVAAANNSSKLKQYSFVDPSPQAGVNYYRLFEYDFDGVHQESQIVAVNVGQKMDMITQVYPNPSSGKTTMIFSSEYGGMYRLNISNVLGEVVYSALVAGIEGQNKFDLNLSEFPNGTYVITIVNPQNSASATKFVKE
jgi:autotransporter-associated beta strand protein